MEDNKSANLIAKKGNEVLPKCGIVMPISATENYSVEHWADVLLIIKDVIITAGFESNLVSDADDIGIIQKRIIQNLYNNEIIVCDVSSKNPNVMFELGIRLAFDKPTIIIKDDHTDYNFDTSIIEHISFKDNLRKKIIGTYEKAKNDPKYSTFLKSFGEYKVAHLEEKEISSDKYILKALEDIRSEVSQLKRHTTKDINPSNYSSLNILKQQIRQLDFDKKIDEFATSFLDQNSLQSYQVLQDPKLKSSIVDYVHRNMQAVIPITKDEVQKQLESTLLPF